MPLGLTISEASTGPTDRGARPVVVKAITSIPPRIVSSPDGGAALAATREAVASFGRSGFDVISLGRAGETQPAHAFPSVTFREGPTPGLFPGRYGPSFGDLLDALGGDGFGAVINADIYMPASNILEVLQNHPEDAFAARRLDVDGLGGDIVGVYRRGIDAVFLPARVRGLLKADRNLAMFQLGAPYWDIVLPIVASFHCRLQFLSAPYICHAVHEANWNEADYRQLRTHAVETVLEHARTWRSSSESAQSFLAGLDDFLAKRKARSPERREKRTAEYLGYWLAAIERTSTARFRVDLNDPHLSSSIQRLVSRSAEGLSLARLLDGDRESSPWFSVVQTVVHALRKARRAQSRAYEIREIS